MARSRQWQKTCGRYIILRRGFQRQGYEIYTSTGCGVDNGDMQRLDKRPDSDRSILVDRSVELHQLCLKLCERGQGCKGRQCDAYGVGSMDY